MSYDLFFRVPEHREPLTLEEFQEYFLERPHYRVAERQAGYLNETTGVYFTFEHSEGEEDDEFEEPELADGLKSAWVSFNLNYFRPHVFGLEAEPELGAFIQRFSLTVDDPQMSGMGRGAYSREEFLKGWNRGNLFAYRVMAGDRGQRESRANSGSLNLLPAAEIERCWLWNYHRDKLQERLGEQIFVPRIQFLRHKDRVQSVLVWTDAIPIALPRTDFVLLHRNRLALRRLFKGDQPDNALVRSATLESFLIDAHGLGDGPAYRLLRQDLAHGSLVAFFKTQPVLDRHLQGIDFDQILDEELLQRSLELSRPA